MKKVLLFSIVISNFCFSQILEVESFKEVSKKSIKLEITTGGPLFIEIIAKYGQIEDKKESMFYSTNEVERSLKLSTKEDIGNYFSIKKFIKKGFLKLKRSHLSGICILIAPSELSEYYSDRFIFKSVARGNCLKVNLNHTLPQNNEIFYSSGVMGWHGPQVSLTEDQLNSLGEIVFGSDTNSINFKIED